MDGFIARKGKAMKNEWIEKHIDEMVRDICKLSEIPSVSIKTENPDMPFGLETNQFIALYRALCIKFQNTLFTVAYREHNIRNNRKRRFFVMFRVILQITHSFFFIASKIETEAVFWLIALFL